jgi:signal transduction histidine kinase
MTNAARSVQAPRGRLADELVDAAHELKTPIAIALALCAGAEDERDPQALREDVKRIEAHVRSLRDQLEAVLDRQARRPAPRRRRRSSDLGALVREACGGYRVLAAQKRLHVTVQTPGTVEAVVVPERVTVAVRNLVSNAVKYAPDGGRVRATVRRHGSWARIEVADDGPGVPVDARMSVFDRFRRLERDARRHPGSGLGLAIVRDVAEEHGGRVAVGDAPEGGALFAIELPLGVTRRRPRTLQAA